MPMISKVYSATVTDHNDERIKKLIKQLREWSIEGFEFYGEENGVVKLPKLVSNKEGTHFTIFTCTHSGVGYDEFGYACGVSAYYSECIGRELLTPLVKEGKVTLEYIDTLC
jgi:hypothetical protein